MLICDFSVGAETELFSAAAKAIVAKVLAAPIELVKYMACSAPTDAMSSALVLSDVVTRFQVRPSAPAPVDLIIADIYLSCFSINFNVFSF